MILRNILLHSEANSVLLVDQIGCLGKIISSDLNISSKILDDPFTLNDQYYKPKRKRRRSKKSKKQDKVISDNSNSFDSNFSDRPLSKSKKQIWRTKRPSDEPAFDGDKCVDKLYKSDSFATCNKISKYSIKQMIRISKHVSCSSSDSSSDDYAFSFDDCAYHSDHISHALTAKSNKYFPIRTATNKHGTNTSGYPNLKLILSCRHDTSKGNKRMLDSEYFSSEPVLQRLRILDISV
ncbi:hypothetical protein L6452_44772 [Arctium lappa]|nr:hypothetical protein L6452_44772 [Arctium lappa]